MVFLFACLLSLCQFVMPLWGRAADDLIDQYISLPGSYSFVRRAPEGTATDRVVMTVFEDFLCPACYNAVTQIIPPIQEKYGNRLEVRFIGYPLAHPESRVPARAYAIVQQMGLGEQMQQALFRARFIEHLDTATHEGLARVADSIGLAPELLLTRLDAGDGNVEVERDLALGESYHIDGVPGVVLDGWILVKTLTPDNLITLIDGILAKKTAGTAPAK